MKEGFVTVTSLLTCYVLHAVQQVWDNVKNAVLG